MNYNQIKNKKKMPKRHMTSLHRPGCAHSKKTIKLSIEKSINSYKFQR